MPANTKPIFPLTPNIAFGSLTAANTATDGTGIVATVFTAGANGARVDRLRCIPRGTNVASVARVFINNGSTNATATNNSLLKEIPLPATAANNAGMMGPDLELALDLALPAGYKLNVVIGTAVSAGWQFTAIGGDY
jgi:hypothetical protein